jgi:hypothetical protein
LTGLRRPIGLRWLPVAWEVLQGLRRNEQVRHWSWLHLIGAALVTGARIGRGEARWIALRQLGANPGGREL